MSRTVSVSLDDDKAPDFLIHASWDNENEPGAADLAWYSMAHVTPTVLDVFRLRGRVGESSNV